MLFDSDYTVETGYGSKDNSVQNYNFRERELMKNQDFTGFYRTSQKYRILQDIQKNTGFYRKYRMAESPVIDIQESK